MFIEPDEYIIAMDHDKVWFDCDELQLLKDAGVKTVYSHAAIRWDLMQPMPDVPFSWDRLDCIVEPIHQAGLKVLIPFMYTFPEWWPDEFFHSRDGVDGLFFGVPSYTNPDTAKEIDWMIEEAIRRYGSDDCQIIYAMPASGELAFHIGTHDGEFHVDKDVFIDWVVARQRLFEAQHGEVWTAYHPFTNPKWWVVYDALFEEFPDSKHYGITFTYVQHNATHFHQRLQENKDRGMIYYGGTEYVQGLRRNVPILMKGDMRMIVCPKHPRQEYKRVDEWMVNEMRWAIGEYEKDWPRLDGLEGQYV